MDKDTTWMKRYDDFQRRRRALCQWRLGGVTGAWLIEAMERLDGEEARLQRAIDDQIVLVRPRGGPPPTIYHHATSPCGYDNPCTFTTKLESYARERRLSPCRTCLPRPVNVTESTQSPQELRAIVQRTTSQDREQSA